MIDFLQLGCYTGSIMSNTAHEIIPISPEQLEIAQTYISTQSIQDTAARLKISEVQVSQYLRKPEVKAYLDHVYISSGYRNRFKLAEVLENILEKKLEELADAEMTSSKDILDIILAIDKLRTNELKHMVEVEKIRNSKPSNQTNIQINATNYDKLIGDLLE